MKLGIRGTLFLVSSGLIAAAVAVVDLYLIGEKAMGPLRGPLGVACVLAAALVLSTLAARLVPRSVRPLVEAARRMAQGDLGIRTRAAGKDEVGALGQALDQLAENLSATLSQLRAERDLLQGILGGMQEGVLVLDEGGRVVMVNPALREMLLLPANVIGQPLLEALRHGELKELLDSARGGRASGEIEVSGIKPRRLLVHAAPLSADGLLAVFVDVTDMRRLESLRRDFVANVSHELRTPVTAVLSAAETLRQAMVRDPEAATGFLDIIERNADRLQRLVEDVLDLSRIESRSFRLNLEPVPLGPAVQHVLSLSRERADKKGLRLLSHVPASLPPARADRRALEQVLTNLVENAVKYCPQGSSAAIEVGAVLDEDGKRLRVWVEDNGPGIEARHLPRLFERFYRVDAGRSRDIGGTGLGLSIVKHLAEAMGGEVSVESTVGKGSVFAFTLQLFPHLSHG